MKVLDFGLAKLTEVRIADGELGNEGSEASMQSSQSNLQSPITNPQLTDTGTVLGTVAYMSPEQAAGQEVDQRTDIFSLGIVLYEITAGALPFKGPTAAATFDALLNRDPPAPIISNPDLSPDLEPHHRRALEKDRDLRYQTASDFRAELKRWQRTLDSSPTTSARLRAGADGVARATCRSRALKAALALMALLVVAAVIGEPLEVFGFKSVDADALVLAGELICTTIAGLVFRDAGKLFLVNSETKKIQEISLHSPNPIIEYGLTADNRTLYYTLLSSWSIWSTRKTQITRIHISKAARCRQQLFFTLSQFVESA